MYQKMLVPLDGSDLAESVLPHVESIAGGCNVSEVVLVRVFEPVQIPQSAIIEPYIKENDLKNIEDSHQAQALEYLDSIVDRLQISNTNITHKILKGPVAESLAQYAEENEVDLIVISTHGRSGISRWVMGSVADKVLRSSCVPILMVRAPGCVPGI